MLARAQTPPTTSMPMSQPGEIGQGRYLVFFDLGRADLNAEGRRVVAEAAQSYRQTGQAQVAVTGYTDTSGSPALNQRLSERRAEAVRVELVRLGVPDDMVSVSGRGQNDLLVPTADGVREPENRRVEIVDRPARASASGRWLRSRSSHRRLPPEPEPDRFLFALGPVYGHNFGEDDADGGDKTQSDMARRRADLPRPAGLPGRRVLEADGALQPEQHRRRWRRAFRGEPGFRTRLRDLPADAQRQFRRHLRQRRAERVRCRPGDRFRCRP